MSAVPKDPGGSRLPVKTVVQVAVIVLVVAAVLVIVRVYVLPGLRTTNENVGTTNEHVETRPAPIPLSSVSGVKPTEDVTADAKTPRDELTAIAGTYTGTILFPEAEISGQAALTIEGQRFTLQAKEKRLTGRIIAKGMDGFIAVELSFGKTESSSGSSKAPSFVVIRASPAAEELPKLSLRATLSVEGWVLRSVPEEKYSILFVQNNCPPYPHCRPVRRCRPCTPKQ